MSLLNLKTEEKPNILNVIMSGKGGVVRIQIKMENQ